MQPKLSYGFYATPASSKGYSYSPVLTIQLGDVAIASSYGLQVTKNDVDETLEVRISQAQAAYVETLGTDDVDVVELFRTLRAIQERKYKPNN